LVIFKGKSVQQQWFIPNKTPNWLYTSSNNAYSSNDIGLQWLQDVFIPQTSKDLPDSQYRLLLLDGHRSHTTLEFMWECYTNKIIPFYLVAHASHILQPLDLTIFSSLKRTYRAAVAFDSDLDDTAPIKKQRFLEYYQKARDRALTKANIASGFNSAGIVPFNPRRVLLSPFIIHKNSDDDIIRPSSPKRLKLQQYVPRTPSNRRELSQAITSIESSKTIPRDLRYLLNKTGVAFDRLQFSVATLQREKASYKRQLDEYRAKSKKKQPINPNAAFANVEDIKKAAEAAKA
jgi:hypothetical protein